ncbi:hypothetical protein [Aequorivita flava]|uniref:SD-repeat containing protein B domain-containing protein n=1 Tax=Aequorivita flava TaxID=3114371 RepID=A0AB35YPL7_9FLAO
MPILKNTTPILVLVLFGIFNGYAQEGNQLDFYFEKDSLSVKQGQSFINFIVLKNNSDSEITLENLKPQETYPGLLLSPQSTYKLLKGEEKRLPIKFIVNTDFMKMKSEEISYQLSYLIEGKKENLEASFFIDRNEERQIALYSFTRENYIDPSQTESTLSLFVENRGFSQRSIKLTFQGVPDGLEIKPREIILALEGQEKRLVEFKVSLKHQGSFYPDYNINVRATDLIDNENVGNTYLKLIILSNNRQLMRGPGAEMGKNFVEVGYNGQSSGFNYLQVKGNSTFLLGKDTQATFNLATDYYLTENQYNFYDTWLEVEKNNTVFRLGNIYANEYDYSVSGRGGLVNTKFGEYEAVEVFALDNSYNLYGTYFPESEGSKLAGAKYSFGDSKDFNGKVSYVFDHDPRSETDSQVASFVSSFALNSAHNFRVETGLSHEKGRINHDENVGLSAGLNYQTKFGKWEFQSLNDIASKSYAGLNRGSLNFNQNIGFKVSQFARLFLQYQNSQVQPEYLSYQEVVNVDETRYYPYYFYSTQSLKTGTQFSFSNWNFSFSPQIEKQKSTNTSFAHELLSYRFRTSIGTSFSGHSFDLSAEYSYSSPSNNSWFHSLKTNLSYRYGGFSLNGSAQYNPNTIMELNNYNLENKNFLNYSAFASYNFNTINNTFTGAIAAGINFSELYSNTNKTLNGNLEYKFSRSWSATGYGNYSQYNSTMNLGYKGSNYQIRVGIKKYFIKATAVGNHKLSLQLFHDKNFNGVFDSDEIALAHETIKLDDFIAITDKNGKVSFSNVPKGSYTLKINETAGLRMVTDPNIIVDRNKTLKISLVKKNKVIGKLVEKKQAYDKLNTSVRGVVVYAKDRKGIVISTVVDQNDTFELFLGNGAYDIYIENNKYEYTNASQKVILENEIHPKTLTFEFKKKNTEIKVKKF